jgi:glycosyltransferase involved in cell wall biosynthesis
MRVCILANSSRYIWNFRVNLIEAIRAAGYDVLAFSPFGTEVSLIQSLGIRHVHLPLAPKSINPLTEIQTVCTLRRLLSEHSVDIVLSSTPKGNLYTALANRGTQRRQIANVSGLGSAYLRQDWLSGIVDALYSLCFKRIDHIFFENPTDHAEFKSRGWIRTSQSEVIPGLGVDLQRFSPSPWPNAANNETRFLMIARLIGDKGVREYIKAASLVRRKHPGARFALLGDSAADNPTGITKDELAHWVAEGHVVHHEHTEDVRPFIADAHCLVLPSYREGMSRTLLEAGAMGRPLIASDVPGCREAVDVGVNGLLCRSRSAVSLADQITRFLSMPSSHQQAMGIASHQKIAAEFNECDVIQRYLDVLSIIDSKDSAI